MANSSIIDDIKTKVVNILLTDPTIVKAMNVPYDDIDDLVGKNIFTFSQNPNVITDSETFITIQVHIPKSSTVSTTWVHPILEMWIISHNKHMKVLNMPRVRANRNDLLSQLIDEKLNGRDDFGYGQMFLQRNIEGVHPDNRDYLYRQLVFETKDLSKPVCR